jgi:hypothetical protein
VEAARAAKGLRRAARTYSNEDVKRQNQQTGLVKYEGKTKKIQWARAPSSSDQHPGSFCAAFRTRALQLLTEHCSLTSCAQSDILSPVLCDARMASHFRIGVSGKGPLDGGFDDNCAHAGDAAGAVA